MQRARRLEQLLAAGEVDQFLRHGHRQADLARDLADQIEVHAEHRLEQDVAHHDNAEAGLGQRAGRDGAITFGVVWTFIGTPWGTGAGRPADK